MRRLLRSVLILSLLLAGLLTLSAGAAAADPVRAVVVYREDADPQQAAAALSEIPGCTVLWTYDTLFSGAAVEVPSGTVSQLSQLAEVAQVGISHRYNRPAAIETPLASSNSLPMMTGSDLLFNGDGTVIAVLDSGLRATHEVFQDYALAQNPAITEADIDAFLADGGTEGRYLSSRIPFAYDYAGRDDDVSTADSHGTHVSAIALGYAENEDGSVRFRGVAPAAQLLSMKVFPDDSSNAADDAVILRALEDAYELGADVINLSLGQDNGFTADPLLSALYSDIFRRMQENGIAVCAAAGNADTHVAQKLHGVPLPTTDYMDYGTVSTPATCPEAVAVAAANAMTYQLSGYIAAYGKQYPFTECVSESDQVLPSLTALEGRELEYTVIRGIGAESDYEGRDVTGRVALVRRGEISFGEKARIAAAHGAIACLVYNNEENTIRPAADDIPIPCAVISLEAGRELLNQTGLDKLGVLTVSGGAYLEQLHTHPTVSASSSRGTTSDLRLVPSITAPGGMILSATAESDTSYDQYSGTSMATPNAAGAYAVLLQAMRARGLSGQEALSMAHALLHSTAAPMQDDSSLLVSPRKQGAGLIDLDAALASPLVITQPILELGDAENGHFTATLQVQNLSDREIPLSASVCVLTDNWETDGTAAYSLLTSRDITDLAVIGGDRAVTVPAGESAELTLTVTIPAEARAALTEVFPNGFFVEGYIHLTPETGFGVHAAYLGFCGDWSAAPILDPVDFRDVLDARAMLAEETDPETGSSLLEAGYDFYHVLPVNTWANLPYLFTEDSLGSGEGILPGENLRAAVPHADGRNGMSSKDSASLYVGGTLFRMSAFTQRNARHLIMIVSDKATGEIYCVDDTQWLPKAAWNAAAMQLSPTGYFTWDGTDSAGQSLPNGTRVAVEFYGWLDSDEEMNAVYDRRNSSQDAPGTYRWLLSGQYDDCLQWSFPLTIDTAAPAVSVAREGDTVTVTVTDRQYTAYAAVYDESDNLLAEEVFADPYPGQPHTLTFTPETMPRTLYIVTADYATNANGYRVELGEEAETSLCAAALLTDVSKEAWYHEAVDFVFTAGLMTGSEPLTFQPGESATRLHVLEALYRLAGAPAVSGTLQDRGYAFTDIPAGADHMDTLLWALDEGLVTGFDETTFGAYANVSRQQLAVLLCRFADGDAGTDPALLAAFSDADRVSDWAAGAMAWAVEEGIFSGRADGSLDPRGYATRAELAQILMLFLSK